jgi:hypothetical protein
VRPVQQGIRDRWQRTKTATGSFPEAGVSDDAVQLALITSRQAFEFCSVVVNGARQAADSVLVTGSAEMKWINGWSAAATFEGEFSNVTRSYAGKGVVRYAW